MFNSKEKKRLKAEQAEKERQEAEFEARYQAKQERKRVEKIIGEMDKQASDLLVKAAEAKQSNQAAAYRNYVAGIKLVRARKAQAKNFLSQVDVMQSMQSITNSSKELLDSMGKIMGSLGKLTLDRDAMIQSRNEFAKTQQNLERQGNSIEEILSGMEMILPEEESMADFGAVDKDIDAEIDSLILGNSIGAMSGAGGNGTSSVQNDIEQLTKALQK